MAKECFFDTYFLETSQKTGKMNYEMVVYDEVMAGILMEMYCDLILLQRFDLMPEAAMTLRVYLN